MSIFRLIISFLLVSGAALGCSRQHDTVEQFGAGLKSTHAQQTPHGKVALAFAQALAAGQFETAAGMLTPALRQQYQPQQLKDHYQQMFAYAGKSAADRVELVETMEFWPGKEPSDIGWAYVSISGPHEKGGVWDEAVTVIVAEQNGQLLVRSNEWGRP